MSRTVRIAILGTMLIVVSSECVAQLPYNPNAEIELNDLLKHPFKREQVDVKKLERLLKAEEEEAFAAAWFIAERGKPGAEILTKYLGDLDARNRTAIIEGIGNSGPKGAACQKLLLEQLRNPDKKIRLGAARAITSIGSPNQDAANVLKEMIKSGNDENSNYYLIEPFGELSRGNPENVATLEQIMDKSPKHTSDCVKALGHMGPSAKAAVPKLVKILSKNNEAACEIVITLGRIGPDASSAVPDLVPFLSSDKPAPIVEMAAEAIGQIGTDDPKVAFALKDGLKAKDKHVRAASATALGRLGKLSKPVLPELEKAIADDDDLDVRFSAVYAKIMIAGANDATVDNLIDIIRKTNPRSDDSIASIADETTCIRAIHTLGRCGALAKRASPDLAEILLMPIERFRSSGIQHQAAWSMLAIGVDDEEIRGKLRQFAAGKYVDPQLQNAIMKLPVK